MATFSNKNAVSQTQQTDLHINGLNTKMKDLNKVWIAFSSTILPDLVPNNFFIPANFKKWLGEQDCVKSVIL